MLAKAVLDPPFFEECVDEIKYWKNLAFQLFYKIEEYEGTQKSKKRPESPTAPPDSKRHKRSSLDPFDFNNICEDAQSYVLQHFNGKDLLAMSEVSTSWNKRVKSAVCDKTILNLSQKKLNLEDIEVLTRKSYKAVSMDLGTFSSFSVSLFPEIVEKLKIINDVPKDRLTFTKLKSLDLHFNSGCGAENFTWIPHVRMDELEELNITSYCCIDEFDVNCGLERLGQMNSDDKYIWKDFIHGLKNLKRLDFDRCSSKYVFNLIDVNRLQLEVLRFCQPDNNHRFELCYTLRKLTIIDPTNLRFAFNDLPELYDLTLELENYGEYDFLNYLLPVPGLPVNFMIKNLSIKLKSDKNINFEELNTKVGIILRSVPELESFFITKLTSELMRFIAGNNLKIKTVKYNEIDDGTLEEYEVMRQKQPDINREIQFIHEV